MPKFRSLAPVRISSITGHVVIIEPEGTNIPDVLVAEAVARGCVPCEGEELKLATPANVEPEVADDDGHELDEGAKQTAIDMAIIELIAANDETKFTGNGKPKVAAVRDIVEFDITADEIAEAFDRVSSTAA